MEVIHVLHVTESAIGIIKQIRTDTPGVPDDATARIQLVASEQEQPGLGFGFSDEPIEGDAKVAESPEIQVYLAPELVEPLAEAVVDAVASDQGTQLILREQETDSQG